MDGKKLSFGFSKVSKKPLLLVPPKKDEKNDVQMIECLEGQSIKIKDAVEEIKTPLIIPVKESKKGSVAYQLKQKEAENKEEASPTEGEQKVEKELSLDELAARELINDAQNRLNNSTSGNRLMQLPIPVDNLPLDGESEPTLDDYESVPISEYGLAMLRGMGWKEGMNIGKHTSKLAALAAPELRPKGLGLGATKVVQAETPQKKVTDKDGKELIITKGAFAKVIAGGQKGNYCEVQGYDNEEGRVIVKIFPRGNITNMNELLLTPVTKEEFGKGSKVLNNAKYDEYKEKSDIKLEQIRGLIKSEQVKVEPKHSDESDNSDNEDIKREAKEDNNHRSKTESRKNRDNRDSYNYSLNDRNKRDRSNDRNKRDRSNSRSLVEKSSKSRNRKHSNDTSDEESSKYTKERSSKNKFKSREDTTKGSRKSSKSRPPRRYKDDSSSEDERKTKYSKSRKPTRYHSSTEDERDKRSSKSRASRTYKDDSSSEYEKEQRNKSLGKSSKSNRASSKSKDRSERKSKKKDKKQQSDNETSNEENYKVKSKSSKSKKYDDKYKSKNSKKKKSKSKHRKTRSSSSSSDSESSSHEDS